jgi:hypothetical protein
MAGQGYPVPATLPQETGCLIVFYPKDEGHFFSQALAGQLTQLNSYWVWDTDISQAHDIGLLWAEHNLRTMLAWENMDCELAEIIEGDNELNVNVNLSGGCGCGCGCGSNCNGNQQGQPFGINPLDPPVTGIPPVPSSEEVTEIDAWKCDAANQLWADWYTFFQEVGIVGGAGIAGVTALAQIAVAFTILTAGVGFLLLLIAGLAVSVAGGITGLTRDWMELHKDGLICAIVSATSPAQARANVLAYIEAHKTDPHGSFAGYWIGQVMGGITGDTNWNLIFTEDSFPIASGNVGSDCAACEPSPLVDFLGDGSYYLVPLIASGSPNISGTATWDANGNEWTYTTTGAGGPGADQDTQVDTSLLDVGRTWASDVQGSAEHAGYVIEADHDFDPIQTMRFTGSGLLNADSTTYPANDIFGIRNTATVIDATTYHDGIAAYFAGLDYLSMGNVTFDNAAKHRAAAEWAGGVARNSVYRTWAVVAASALNPDLL